MACDGGIDLPVEFPTDPHLRVDNSTDRAELGQIAEEIVRAAGIELDRV